MTQNKLQDQIDELKGAVLQLQDMMLLMANQLYALAHPDEQDQDVDKH